ncbi:FAR1-related sequence 10 [Tanacetum coccineum]
MHYARRFTDSPNKQYVECYEDDDDFLLYYQIPLKSLDIGLKPLVSDSDISNLLGFVNKHKMMYVYVEQVEKTESYSDKDGEGDSESEDANDFVDEEYLVDEVEVNMSSFKFQIDGEDDTGFIDHIQPHVNVTEDDLEVLDFDSLENDQDDVPENSRSRGLRKLRKKHMSSGIRNNLFVGKEFPNRNLAKDRIRAYAVETRRNLDFKRNDKRRIRVICNGVVPTLNNKNDYVDKHKAFRAKARVYLRGDVKEQYSLLRDYANEVQRCNPDTTVKIDVYGKEDLEKTTRMFRRIYVCLGALKRGFKEGGRELLGLDGAFMRGKYPGQMLTAVGVDANNGIYPVAYGIVESENQYSWTWFLTCLAFDLFSNFNFTFITDRQKGLLPIIARLFPSVEHRKWEISGIPCKHDIAAIHDMADNCMDVSTPEDWVHESYKLQTWMNVYSHKINPVNGRDLWSDKAMK